VARLLLVAVAVGLSNFAAAVAIGLSGVDARTRLRVALVFGFFEASMPVVGLLVGDGLASSIGSASRWIGGGLLLAVGLTTVVRSGLGKQRGQERGRASPTGGGALFVTAAALSIDNLVVGFALGTQAVPITLAAVVIAAVSVGMSLIGLEVGDRMGQWAQTWSDEIGGVVLMGVGAAVATGAF
jgi:manganese efflux pump family protein